MYADWLRRALDYPYNIPCTSYVYSSGAYRKLDGDVQLDRLNKRYPVLALGSNMSPNQLARKFSDAAIGAIPVTRVRLLDFDSVYSSQIAAYGAIPATLYHSPGTEVVLFITWLNERQLERMHQTELTNNAYQFCILKGISSFIERGPKINELFFYRASVGALSINDMPVPLETVMASNRNWTAKSQHRIQSYLKNKIFFESALSYFVWTNINIASIRIKRQKVLSRLALPLNYDDVYIIEN